MLSLFHHPSIPPTHSKPNFSYWRGATDSRRDTVMVTRYLGADCPSWLRRWFP